MLRPALETLGHGKRIRVARLGEGPPLLMLHGYPENLQIWCELAPQLVKHFTVIAFDWPGMGYSDPWPGGATPVHLAERLRDLVDEWQLDRVSLLGMDMGGQPALAFAALHPERVARLVVMNSLVFGDGDTSWEIRILRRFGWNRFILRHLPRPVFYRAERTFLPAGMRLSTELRKDFWCAFRRPSVRRYISKMCAGYQGTLSALPSLYAEIRCPVLILWAGKDRHFPPVHARRLHQAIAGSVLEIVPDAEHWMAWYLADLLQERLIDFAIGR